MKNNRKGTEGVSEVVSAIIIVALLLVLAMVVYALFFGSISGYLKQTSRIAATAGTVKIPLSTSAAIQLPYAQPASGDKYYLSGQVNVPSGYPVASFVLRDPSGVTHIVKNSTISSKANQYGTPLFMYQDRTHNYWVTDSLTSVATSSAQLIPLSQGTWTVTMVDNTANVPLTEMKVTIGTDSSTVNPQFPNYTTSCGSANGATGSGISNNSYGITCGTGPNGMTTMHFNGINSNISLPDNPDETFTGNMAISLWMDPTATGSSSDTANWHQILGKGSVSGTTENDNYQLFQIGNQLVFEWNDATNPTVHYQAITNAPASNALSAGSWNYVSVSVSGGTVQIYNNGAALPLVYNQGVDPRSVVTPSPNPPVVNLQGTSNPVTIGKQNGSPGSEFYYSGDIGNLAVYNRALTTSEIQHNNLTYQA